VFVHSALQDRDVGMHPETGQSLSIHTLLGHVKFAIETFSAQLKDPLGLHHAKHHGFPI